MDTSELDIKLEFISGLKEIVIQEISQYPDFFIKKTGENFIYLNFVQDFFQLKKLKSVLKVFIVTRSPKYNPSYLSKHKSIVGNIVAKLLETKDDRFNSFQIICAGSDSSEIRSMVKYIQETYKLVEQEDSDLKIHVVKRGTNWEVGAQITSRPLSVRDYKVMDMEGAMNPTIAYAINSLGELNSAHSYLNVFSGSATLLIEAGQAYPNLQDLVGFDNNKENLSLAMTNIKEAGLIRKIELKEKDIFQKPNLGKFDIITSDLPFGMLLAKYEDLKELYQHFIDYCQKTLRSNGVLVIYTSKSKIWENIISNSDFEIIKKLELKLASSSHIYFYPKIFKCKFKTHV